MANNQVKLIATLKTPTAALSDGPSDVHLDAQGKPVPHVNQVATSKSTSGMTGPNTLIDTARIVLQEQTNIGPPSESPWPGELGKTSGVTGMEANVKKGSPNVKAESLPIARFQDPTFQNKKNCSGKIIITDPSVAAQALELQKSLRCKIKSLKTECGHGRAAGTERRLQVIYGDTVKLTAKRINGLALKADGTEDDNSTPVCEKAPNHTHFVISREGYIRSFGKVSPLNETKYGDTFTLDSAWIEKGAEEVKDIDMKAENQVGPVKMSRSDTDNAKSGAEVVRVPDRPKQNAGSAAAVTQGGAEGMRQNFLASNASGSPRNRPKNVGADGLTDNQRARVDQAANYEKAKAERSRILGKQGEFASKQKRDAYVMSSLMTIIEVIKSRPYIIKVEALSCAGPMKVDVEVYPDQKYVLDIVSFVQPIVTAMKFIKASVEVFEKFFKAAGLGVKLTFNFLSNPYGFVSWQWKEAKDWKVYPVFEVQAGFEKVIEFEAEFRVGIIGFLGPLGRFATWLLEKINCRGDIGAFASIYVGIGLSGTMDNWAFTPGPLSLPLGVEIGVFAEITAGYSFSCKVEVKVTFKFQFKNKPEMSNGAWLKIILEKIEVKATIEFNVQADVFGLRGGRQFEVVIGEWQTGRAEINWLPDFPAALRP